MASLILTSNGIDSKEIFDQLKKYVTKNTTVAMVTTANEKKEKSEGNQTNFKEFEKLGAKQIDFVDIEKQNPEVLLDYDVVYLGGGNPFRLMYWIKKSKSQLVFKKLFNSNKIIIGNSAGTMVLGKNYGIAHFLTPEQNTFGLKEFSGLGFSDLSFTPHSNKFPKIFNNFDEAVLKCKKEFGVEITKLYDGQAIIYENNCSECKLINGKALEQ